MKLHLESPEISYFPERILSFYSRNGISCHPGCYYHKIFTSKHAFVLLTSCAYDYDSLYINYHFVLASQPMSNPHVPQYRPPPLNQYPTSPMAPPTNPLHMIPPNTNQFRFTAPHQSQQQRFPIQLPNSNPAQKQSQLQQQFLNQYRFPQSPNQGPPPHIPTPPLQTPVSTGGISTDNKNWQDGLRALLPNINISFSSK